ncbi:MAG: class I SAM-dependent methyltransferase [Candidatus Obscuribacterales bacterium]|nr:class I SAM-dependent methyltransferase [Candidatus Obscuribacterales bacterium]
MTPSADRKSHDSMQSDYFNERVNFFCQPIPKDIQERTREIVGTANLSGQSWVLDVGCGVGVLFGHFLEAGVLEEHITGCDLSSEMLKSAKERYRHAKYFQGDIIDFPANLPHFDAIFFNACFGNIFDQKAALQKAAALLKPEGVIVISHPLGSKFVEQLHENEPHIVPHLLPDKETLTSWLGELAIHVNSFRDEELLYIACLQRD